MTTALTRRPRRSARRPRFARVTDAEIIAALTVIPVERYDAGLEACARGAARDGLRITAYEVFGVTAPPALEPFIIVVHAAEQPSMPAIRAAYLGMRRRCAEETA